MSAVLQEIFHIGKDRNMIHLYKQYKKRNECKQEKRDPIRDVEQFQNLHQIDHIEITNGKIDQKTDGCGKSFCFAIKNKSRKSHRKPDISNKQLYKLNHI